MRGIKGKLYRVKAVNVPYHPDQLKKLIRFKIFGFIIGIWRIKE
jgi:hypothetical protein